MMNYVKHALVVLWVICCAIEVQAEQRLAQIFQDNLVLQREKPVAIWGWGEPQMKVEVSFAGQKKQATCDDKGYWKVSLDPMPANKQGQVLEAKIGDKTISCKNVLIGEVWIASGQSNMVHAGPDTDTGVYPHFTPKGKAEIRIAAYGWGASLEPLDDADPAWRDAKSWETMKENPAEKTMGLSNYFARVLRDELDIPVGIIRVAVPGTNQAAWMSKATLEGFPGEGGKNFYESFLAEHEEKLGKSNGPIKSFADFKSVESDWRKDKKGRWPGTGLVYYNFPTSLYNTRIHPLAPFTIRGVIWHQGEAGPTGPYGQRLVAMIKQWRELFGQDFDFIWGTLSRGTTNPPPMVPARGNFYRSNNNNGIRGALKLFGDDKHVALVDIYDLGNDDTHFLQKAEAGRRFANAALTITYGKPAIYSGPRMTEVKVEGAVATVKFDFVGNGIIYKPSINGISGVYIRGKNVARWGNVKVIDKSTIEVSHPDVPQIETVAYAEHPNPHETLFNSDGLPATPFTFNPTNTRDEPATYQLVEAVGSIKGNDFHIAHVRSEGYMLQLKPTDKSQPGDITLRAFVPADWKGVEVRVGGKAVEVKEETKDGRKFVTFSVKVPSDWVIVANQGAADAMEKVNRY